MPKIGDIRRAGELGFKGTDRYIWSACPDCGEERWIRLKEGKPEYLRCGSCNKKGEKSSQWKGGRYEDSRGYVLILINRTSPFAKMRDRDGYIKEHRLVMARHLGRCLESWEIIHHINGIKTDNRIENLAFTGTSEHSGITLQINKLIKRIRELEKENESLKELSGGK